MINRPSYAQRSLELTRCSLQRVPTHLTPVVTGVFAVASTGSVTTTDVEATGHVGSMARLVDLQRWRRKSARPARDIAR